MTHFVALWGTSKEKLVDFRNCQEQDRSILGCVFRIRNDFAVGREIIALRCGAAISELFLFSLRSLRISASSAFTLFSTQRTPSYAEGRRVSLQMQCVVWVR